MPSKTRSTLRTLVRAFPPLKIALAINDFICWSIKKILEAIGKLFRYIFDVLYSIVKTAFRQLVDLLQFIPWFRRSDNYQRINEPKQHKEPIPYRNDLLRRSITYQGGIVLGAMLYVFVYFVLIKHHTYTTVAVALVIFLAYLIVLENSHNIRSIIMLCLPIMFTNRGRALVFCCMLTLLVSGPISNAQSNVKELHSSLTCCKQYLLIKSDKYVEKNIVQNMVRIEDLITKLVDNIKKIAAEIKSKIDLIIEMALAIEDHLARALQKLKEIVDICNNHTAELLQGCQKNFSRAYYNCRTSRMSFLIGAFCEILVPLKRVCDTLYVPDVLCSLPAAVVKFIDQTVGQRLKNLVKMIENELYVDIDIKHSYTFNGTKSKSFKQVASEISFDVEQKFWYIHFVSRVFRLVSLILVVWIITTATLYHMHFLSELNYDNMYLDDNLKKVEQYKAAEKKMDIEDQATVRSIISDEEVRSELDKRSASPNLIDLTFPGEDEQEDNKDVIKQIKNDRDKNKKQANHEDIDYFPVHKESKESSLFPLTKRHQREYLTPFSVWMNKVEISKVKVSGLVWTVIMIYIMFFVALDYILYKLIVIIYDILKEILFTSELPLVDIETKSGDQVTHYNRTHIDWLRKRRSQSIKSDGSRVGLFYRKMMDSIEGDIPDDITILDSLEGCLPKANRPPFKIYKTLIYLALFTFAAVIVEAYALRTRHWIASLYYPRRARQRAVWLYRKLRSEKAKYEDVDDNDYERKVKPDQDKSTGGGFLAKTLELGVRLLTDKAGGGGGRGGGRGKR